MAPTGVALVHNYKFSFFMQKWLATCHACAKIVTKAVLVACYCHQPAEKIQCPITPKQTLTRTYNATASSSGFDVPAYVSAVPDARHHLHEAAVKRFRRRGGAPGCEWQESRRPDWGVYGVMTGALRSEEELQHRPPTAAWPPQLVSARSPVE